MLYLLYSHYFFSFYRKNTNIGEIELSVSVSFRFSNFYIRKKNFYLFDVVCCVFFVAIHIAAIRDKIFDVKMNQTVRAVLIPFIIQTP